MVPSPLSPYAITKVTDESYVRLFASLYGLETINLRYFNVFGPNQLPDGPYAAAIPRFISAALRGVPIEIYGDGEQTRDFCFIDNTVQANLLAADTPTKLKGEVVNIAGGRRISLNALVEQIGKALGRTVEVRHVAPRAGDIQHSLADISQAKALLGYEPKVRWEDGIPPTIEFLRQLAAQGLS
jgi:UDP-glucose 4-epimerase